MNLLILIITYQHKCLNSKEDKNTSYGFNISPSWDTQYSFLNPSVQRSMYWKFGIIFQYQILILIYVKI